MIKFHELKDKLIDELHNRPFPQIKIPARQSCGAPSRRS